MKKAALHNLGCKVNSYETEALTELLIDDGYEIVEFGELADVYVINTCSVTNMADRKSRQMIHKCKKINPEACVVATGCYIQNFGKDVIEELGADILLGNNKKGELITEINKYFQKHNIYANIDDINDGVVPYEKLHITKDLEHTRAFVKVQDGCNMFCSYCIIPYARGRNRSRTISDVVEEVIGLVNNGYKEVVLTGIHLSSFGKDTGESLVELIEAVNKISDLSRIRLGSLEPQIVTADFVSRIVKCEKLCPHFHLSLQSGCDNTLKTMNRHYTAAEYLEGCNILRKYYLHPAITTDVIVGFPGESEEDFEDSAKFVETVNFYEMHIFMYSKRKGTRAANMPSQVSETDKKMRSAKLIALGNEMSKAFRDFYIGREEEVLLEEKVKIDNKDYYIGFTKEYVKVAVLAENKDLSNSIIKGKITSFLNDDTLLLVVI